ncbi:hypothetical protein [Candidatus Tisiphia endosymbiont of Beris chalybata]|uniref:hypothetical protein n=1 Tax=Candidatus Tisiphia endosymbiont of Beris chalybata TaxID=3066262 RepID=UPI00312CAE19
MYTPSSAHPLNLKQYQELPYIEKRIIQLHAFSKINISKVDFLKVVRNILPSSDNIK